MKKLAIVGGAVVLIGAVIFAAGYFISGGNVSAMNIDTGLFHISVGKQEAYMGNSSPDTGTGESSTPDTGTGTGESTKTQVSSRSGRNEYTFSAEGVTGLRIRDTSSDVVLGLSGDEKIHVICYEEKGSPYKFTEGETLTIESGRSGIFGIGIDWHDDDDTLKVLIPEGVVLTADVETTSGDIKVQLGALRTLKASSTSGDAEVSGLNAQGGVYISTTSGDIEASGVSCPNIISASSSSGDIELKSLEATAVEASASSGKIECGKVTANSVDISATSGNIEFSELSVSESLRFKTTSGKIEGKLYGMMADYSITSKTTSGDNSLPEWSSSGSITLNAEATSGNIRIRFADN